MATPASNQTRHTQQARTGGRAQISQDTDGFRLGRHQGSRIVKPVGRTFNQRSAPPPSLTFPTPLLEPTLSTHRPCAFEGVRLHSHDSTGQSADIVYLASVATLTTASDALKLSPAQLAARTRLPQPECHQLLHQVAVGLCALPQNDARTVAEILELEQLEGEEGEKEVSALDVDEARFVRRFTTGDPGLDRLLGGGIELGNVTEVAGQS